MLKNAVLKKLFLIKIGMKMAFDELLNNKSHETKFIKDI